MTRSGGLAGFGAILAVVAVLFGPAMGTLVSAPMIGAAIACVVVALAMAMGRPN